MAGHLRHTRGIRIGVNRVAASLKRVSGNYHRQKQVSTARLLNPIPLLRSVFRT